MMMLTTPPFVYKLTAIIPISLHLSHLMQQMRNVQACLNEFMNPWLRLRQ